MKIEKLDWDSNFFGIKIGKVDLVDDSIFDWKTFNETVVLESYALVYVFKLKKMLSGESVRKANLELTDIQLTMSKRFNSADYLDVPYDLKNELTAAEQHDCYAIAEETAVVSRFFKEEKIGPSVTRALYRKWIDNALNRSFSDGVFLDLDSTIVSGIHLIKTDPIKKIGYFTLTGVNPNYKRMGIGHQLWRQSYAYWARETAVEIIKSSFSIQNEASFNFHLKEGFDKVEETKFIYHYRAKAD